MEPSEIKRILTAPINLVRWSNEEERALFPSKEKQDSFCTFGLSSGQTFVGHIPEEGRIFTFKPFQNLLPGLLKIEWEKAKDIADLGYTTICYTSAKISKKETVSYRKALIPKPDKSAKHPITKIAFKYYTYHPLLEQAILIQDAIQDYRKKERALIASQKNLETLLFSEKSPFAFQNRSRV